MRAWPVVLALFLFMVPSAVAEFGPEGPDGWPVNVDGESTNPFPGRGAGPLNEVAGATLYPYWPLLTAELMQLAADHPDLVKLHSIGKSTLGLDLWMVEIADHARIAKGEGKPLDEREVVWVDGGTHSNEYSGVYFVAHLARFLTDEYTTNETAKWIVENRHTWIMPMVNPDGSNAFGRLNANLVNINRNYPVVWDGVGNDALMNNRGPAPASEVETRLNIEWFNKTQPDYYASVHCCGNLWLYPYGEEGVDPLDNVTLSRVCQEAFPSVLDDCGPIWSTIYPASGSSVDTAYEYTGAVAFGYEMSGRGAAAFWGQPFTLESVRQQEVESWEGVLHAFLNVHRYGAYPVVTDVRADAEGLELDLLNEGYGPLVRATFSYVDRQGEALTTTLEGLEAGATTSVVLPGDFAPGQMEVQIDYVKRIQAEPMGATQVSLVLYDGPNGLTVETADHAVDLRPHLAEESPAVPVVALVALAVGLVVARRVLRR